MFRSNRVGLLVPLLGLLGCGGGVDPAPLKSRASGQLPTSNEDACLPQKIGEALQAIESYKNTCSVTQTDLLCQPQAFDYDPNQFNMSPSTGEAILIVDEFSKLPLRALRYKNRIKGFLRAQQGGTIGPAEHQWNIPATLFNVLSGFNAADLIAAESLRELAAPLNETFGYLNYENIGHGSAVFSLLIEANPHQPIVLLDRPVLSSVAPLDFCETGPESDERLRAASSQVASELRRIMSQHNVRFVNVSFGETLATIRSSWMSNCMGDDVPSDELLRGKLAAYQPIMDALFNTPGVFGAQAAISASNPQDFPYDYPSAEYPNRILAGYFTSLDSGLDAQGGGDSSGLSGWPQRANVDVYLNSGVLSQRPFPYNRTPLLQVDGFGVDIYPISYTMTSWIAPLALSRFIHVRYSSFGDRATMDDALIAEIRARMVPQTCGASGAQGACVYQDPLLHGQLEAVRLGYRSLEYLEPFVRGDGARVAASPEWRGLQSLESQQAGTAAR